MGRFMSVTETSKIINHQFDASRADFHDIQYTDTEQRIHQLRVRIFVPSADGKSKIPKAYTEEEWKTIAPGIQETLGKTADVANKVLQRGERTTLSLDNAVKIKVKNGGGGEQLISLSSYLLKMGVRAEIFPLHMIPSPQVEIIPIQNPQSLPPLVDSAPRQHRASPPPVQGIPRQPGAPEIQIPITVISDLTFDDLPEIMNRVNRDTLNQPYAVDRTHQISHNGKTIYRPNHNGVHAARKVRYMEGLFELIETRGSPQARSQLQKLTSEERNALLLATYLMRSGRCDESNSHHPIPDNYHARSAAVFEAYARQLGMSDDVRDWASKLISNATKPWQTQDPKDKFGYELLSAVHEMDLVRCCDKDRMDEVEIPLLQRMVSGFMPEEQVKSCTQELLNFAMDACRQTGDRLECIGQSMGDLNAFVSYSLDGRSCWQRLQAMQFPWARA